MSKSPKVTNMPEAEKCFLTNPRMLFGSHNCNVIDYTCLLKSNIIKYHCRLRYHGEPNDMREGVIRVIKTPPLLGACPRSAVSAPSVARRVSGSGPKNFIQ